VEWTVEWTSVWPFASLTWAAAWESPPAAAVVCVSGSGTGGVDAPVMLGNVLVVACGYDLMSYSVGDSAGSGFVDDNIVPALAVRALDEDSG